jgi:hypothetical protein
MAKIGAVGRKLLWAAFAVEILVVAGVGKDNLSAERSK